MKCAELKTKQNQELLELYEAAALEHGRATEEGDPKAANRAHDLITSIRHELMDRGRDSEMMISNLLQAPEPWVRSWAATDLLGVAPDAAVPVLEEIAQEQRGYLGLQARMVLQEWRAGRLRLP